MRAMGIDLGGRRIGVAVGDAAGTLASPIEVVQRSGDEEVDHRRLAALVAEWEVEVVVVGLPLSLDGSSGPAATAYRAEADRLAGRLAVPVHLHDERFTTVTAERQLREAGVRGRAQRDVVDQAAAAVLLQSWLDARTARQPSPHCP